MIDCFQLLNEYCFGILDVAESERTLFEIAISHLSVNESLYEFTDRLFCIVG
jgi:hypothetical protein